MKKLLHYFIALVMVVGAVQSLYPRAYFGFGVGVGRRGHYGRGRWGRGYRGRYWGRGYGYPYGRRGYWGYGPTISVGVGGRRSYDYDDYRDKNGRSYWTVRNNTPYILSVQGSGNRRSLEPGEEMEVNHENSFELDVRLPGQYRNEYRRKKRHYTFTTEDHYVDLSIDEDSGRLEAETYNSQRSRRRR